MTMTSEKAGWGTAVATTLFVFCLAADQVMMPLATSGVVQDLNTNTGMVLVAIALASLVAAPLYITGGKLGDINGKKKLFLVGVILFTLGPITAVITPNITLLILGWSIAKALGIVLAIPASIDLLIASYPNDAQRRQAFTIYGGGGVAAALLGPLLMGFSSQIASWRLPYGFVILLLLLTLLLSTRSMQETERVEGVKVDWVGTFLAFLAVACLILGPMAGGRFGWLLARRPFTIGNTQINPFGLSPAPLLLILGILVTAVLLVHLRRTEKQGGQPLFSMKLFKNRTYFAGWGAALFAFILSGAIPFMIPVFTEEALGFGTVQSAFIMVSFSIASVILGFIAEKLLGRLQPRTLIQLFLGVMIVGLLWLVAVADVNMTVTTFLLPMLIIGAGFGVVGSQIPNIQMAHLLPELQDEGSGFAESGKELGIGLGTAVIGSIMFSMAIGGFVDKVAQQVNLQLSVAQRTELILLFEDDAVLTKALEGVPQWFPNIEQLAQESFVQGFQIALGALAGTLLIALLLASFIPKISVEDVTAEEVREVMANVSSKRV